MTTNTKNCEPIGYTSQKNLEQLRTLHGEHVVGIHRAKTDGFSVPLYTNPPHDTAVSEPAAWRITTEVINEDMRPAGKKTFVTDDGKQAYLHATNNAAVTPLYTAPHDDEKVARDAERYRWLREHFHFQNDSVDELWFDAEIESILDDPECLDQAIDAAIKEQRSPSKATGSSGGEKR